MRSELSEICLPSYFYATVSYVPYSQPIYHSQNQRRDRLLRVRNYLRPTIDPFISRLYRVLLVLNTLHLTFSLISVSFAPLI